MKGDITIRKLADIKGFTLVEVIIAIFMLTIAFLALVSVTVMVIKGNSFSKMITTATTLANDQLETLKNTSFSSIASSSWSTVTNFPNYERQWTVTSVTGNSSCTGSGAPFICCTGSGAGKCPDKKTIVMEVRWLWQGNYHNVTLNSIIVQ